MTAACTYHRWRLYRPPLSKYAEWRCAECGARKELVGA